MSEYSERQEYARVVRVYRSRSDEENWAELLEQSGRVARKDYLTNKQDHQAAMEFLWDQLDARGVLREKYRASHSVRDDSNLGIFVKTYESVSGVL